MITNLQITIYSASTLLYYDGYFIKLKDIPAIVNSLKYDSTKCVHLLNEIVFDDTFDWATNKRVRDFSGFFNNFHQEHKEQIFQIFSIFDFLNIVNLLHLDASRNEHALCDKNFQFLLNFQELQQLTEIFWI